MAHAPYTDVLEAGDRLAVALQAGDFDAAALALDDRRRALEVLAEAGLGRPPAALTERARAQADRLALAFGGGLESLSRSLSTAARAAHAGGRYRPPAARPVLDTAPR